MRRSNPAVLPMSGIGVIAPWLVLAPIGHPVIRLDLRRLDRVEVLKDVSEDDDDAEAVVDRWSLLLVCGQLEVAMFVADGLEAVQRLVREATPLTRDHAATDDHPSARAVATDVAPEASPGPATHASLLFLNEIAVESGRLPPRKYDLIKPVMIVGRTDDIDIAIEHTSISRRHAEITRDAATGRYTVRDLQSSNGVRVNGEEVTQCELRDGDLLDLGHVRMRFVDPVEAALLGEDGPAGLEHFLTIGRDAVVRRGELIHVGSLAFRLREVREYALNGANLPLAGGRQLQAAMALLVVEAAARDQC